MESSATPISAAALNAGTITETSGAFVSCSVMKTSFVNPSARATPKLERYENVMRGTSL
jgi:hypothetical protein